MQERLRVASHFGKKRKSFEVCVIWQKGYISIDIYVFQLLNVINFQRSYHWIQVTYLLFELKVLHYNF